MIVVVEVPESKDQTLVVLFIKITFNFVNAKEIVRHHLHIDKTTKSVTLTNQILHEITKMITWRIVATNLLPVVTIIILALLHPESSRHHRI